MSSPFEEEITAFIHEYASLFASSAASSSSHVAELCQRIGKCYRPGLTMFTSGKVERFEVRSASLPSSHIVEQRRSRITN